MQTPSVQSLFQGIAREQKEDFNQLFYRYYDRLVAFAMQYVQAREPAEEIVSALFVSLWQKREKLDAIRSPEVYLFIAVKNGCLNYLRRLPGRFTTLPDDAFLHNRGVDIHGPEYKELVKVLNMAISKLPEQRRIIFRLIKEEGLKAKEVAEILSVSVRTVESQLYKAVKSLAAAVSHYLGYDPQQKKQQSGKDVFFFLFF
ncbi:hypothetical protein A8C56_17685 [Niabella ginsenosidivorans]|uniref:RNA polymerase sigma-70 factor n=2 Tax=Niabella ginsenosidivorans TaxID=1176587 RepID=A0A1A9IB90_9BACT|nr:hypothetical protein A8C56_17685 [Niabella ginsenosidivorans]